MSALSSNTHYLNFCENFPKYGIEEEVPCVQGFVLGMLAQGFTSSSREIMQQAVEILNNGKAFSGMAIATFTTLVIEMERELKKKEVQLYIPEKDDNIKKLSEADFKEARLKAMAAAAYGLSLGLSMTPSGPLKMDNLKRSERDNFIILEQISNVSTEEALEEEDFKVVIDSMIDILYSMKS